MKRSITGMLCFRATSALLLLCSISELVGAQNDAPPRHDNKEIRADVPTPANSLVGSECLMAGSEYSLGAMVQRDGSYYRCVQARVWSMEADIQSVWIKFNGAPNDAVLAIQARGFGVSAASAASGSGL
ncbi:hypothetical protein [Paucibacter soli]|uniref:hypothetical protein n=1 Tax=Paucibacter soli TaxID=3133433 RepID=UPI0030A92A0A